MARASDTVHGIWSTSMFCADKRALHTSVVMDDQEGLFSNSHINHDDLITK